MAWMFWLSAPVLAGAGAAVRAWWLGRPRRHLGTAAAVREHADYLRALDDARPLS